MVLVHTYRVGQAKEQQGHSDIGTEAARRESARNLTLHDESTLLLLKVRSLLGHGQGQQLILQARRRDAEVEEHHTRAHLPGGKEGNAGWIDVGLVFSDSKRWACNP